jgi:hypothetical protein
VFNLFLAVIWLAVAGMLFALPWFNPHARPWNVPNTQLSVGWFALCLCCYNLVRWWTTRRSSVEPPAFGLRRRRSRDAEDEP